MLDCFREGDARTKTRCCLLGALWSGAGALALLAVTLVTWLLLSLLGDASGARVARGFSVFAIVILGIDVLVTAAILVFGELKRLESASTESRRPDGSSGPKL